MLPRRIPAIAICVGIVLFAACRLGTEQPTDISYTVVQKHHSLPSTAKATSHSKQRHHGHTHHRPGGHAHSSQTKGLVVKIEKPISQQRLETLSRQLKSDEAKDEKGLYLSFFLEGMRINPPPWAIGTFSPSLSIDVIGLTAEQIRSLKRQPPENTIGTWLDAKRSGGIFYLVADEGEYTMIRRTPANRFEFRLESLRSNRCFVRRTDTILGYSKPAPHRPALQSEEIFFEEISTCYSQLNGSTTYLVTPRGRLKVFTKNRLYRNIAPLY